MVGIRDQVRQIHNHAGGYKLLQLTVINDEQIAQISTCRSGVVQLIASDLWSQDIQRQVKLILKQLSVPSRLLSLIIGRIAKYGDRQRLAVIARIAGRSADGASPFADSGDVFEVGLVQPAEHRDHQ